jgi:hypothetical protein
MVVVVVVVVVVVDFVLTFVVIANAVDVAINMLMATAAIIRRTRVVIPVSFPCSCNTLDY